MDEHGKRRLGDRHRMILPVECWGSPMPPELGRFQVVKDISAQLLSPDPRFRYKKWYQDLVAALGTAIAENAQELAGARKAANCDPPLWISREPALVTQSSRLPFQPL